MPLKFSAQTAPLLIAIPRRELPMTLRTLPLALPLLPPAMANAADIGGVPKIRDGDQIQIGSTRIRLGGIDAPSSDQLCLNPHGERWTCGVAAKEELIRHVRNKPCAGQ